MNEERRRGARRTTGLVVLIAIALGAASCSTSSSTDSAASGANQQGSGTSQRTATSTGTALKAADLGPSDGCRSAAPIAPGEEEIHLDVAGADRWYLRHVPPSYSGTTPVPLVIDIHGYAEGARLHSSISGMGAHGDANGFVTLTPNGQGTPVHWDANLGSRDVGMIGTILDRAETELCIDRSRVYVTGFSNGAFMTSVVACQYSDRVAAVAPVAGMRDVPGCTFKRPVPVITFHGTADHFVEFNGGMGSGAAALPAPDGSGRTLGELGASSEANAAVVPGSMDQTMPDISAAWASRNGCQTTPSEAKIADDVTLVTFSCPPGDEVELYRVSDGGHAWPGSAGSVAISSVTGRTTMSVVATKLIWDFFKAHSNG